MIKDDAIVTEGSYQGVKNITYTYKFAFNYDFFPNDFMISYAVRYGSIPPIFDVQFGRPDGESFDLISSSLPSPQGTHYVFKDTLFSTDSQIHESLRSYVDRYSYNVDVTRPEVMIFSAKNNPSVLKGIYTLKLTFSFFDENGADKVLKH